VEPEYKNDDWIVLTASCDMENNPKAQVLLGRVFEANQANLKAPNDTQFKERLEVLKRGQYPNRHLLAEFEEGAFRFALQLHRALPQMPAAPLAEPLQHLVRLSSRIAAELGRHVRPEGAAETELLWDERSDLALSATLSAPSAGASRWTPLADWRAVVVPPEPDEAFRVEQGRADDPACLADAARMRTRGTYHVLEAENLLVFPAGREGGETEIDAEDRSSTFHALKLRAVQCVLTDPVSFAVAAGAKVAAFPQSFVIGKAFVVQGLRLALGQRVQLLLVIENHAQVSHCPSGMVDYYLVRKIVVGKNPKWTIDPKI